MVDLYKKNSKEVDRILADEITTQEGTFLKTDRACYVTAKKYKKRVTDPKTFRRVVNDGVTQAFSQSQATAVGKILDLAAK
jgi:hypothetical protein